MNLYHDAGPRWTHSSWWIAYLAFAGLLALLTDASSGTLGRTGYVLTGGLVLASLLAGKRDIVYVWLLFLIPSRDITSSVEDLLAGTVTTSSTIWQLAIGPIRPSWLIVVLLLAGVARIGRVRFRRLDVAFILYFLLFMTGVTLLMSGDGRRAGGVVSDLRVPIFLMSGIVLIRGHLSRWPDDLGHLTKTAVALLLVRHGLDLAYLVLGRATTVISQANRVSVDSGKGLVVVLAVVALLALSRGLARRTSWAWTGILLGSLILVVAYQTRFLLVSFGLSVLALLVAMRPIRAIRTFGVVGFASAFALAVFAATFPVESRVASLRASSLVAFVETLDLQRLDATRFGQIASSQSTLAERGANLTGLGYGAWYHDDSRLLADADDSAFDWESLRTGRFERVHDFVFHIWFKFGVVGLLLYTGLFAQPLWHLWRARLPRHHDLWLIRGALLGSAPLVLLNLFWTPKGLLLSGAFVALARTAAFQLGTETEDKEPVPEPMEVAH